MSRRALAWTAAVTAGAAFAACQAPKTPEAGPIEDDVLEELPCVGQRPLKTEVDVVGLDPSVRASLDAARKQGPVIVHYKGHGCDLRFEVLASCTAQGSYAFGPYSATDSKLAHSISELYTELPLGASRLATRLRDSPAIRMDMTLVGTFTLSAASGLHVSDLKGDCANATHVVTKVVVGGFAIASGDARTLEASPPLLADTSGRGIFAREGNAKACQDAQDKSAENPACDVPMRVVVAPLEAACGGDAAPCPPPAATPPPPPLATIDAGPADARAGDGQAPEGGAPLGSAVAIGGGTFTMGPKTRFAVANDPLRHTVTVAPFQIDGNEVTVEDYQHCVEQNVCKAPATDQPTCNYGKADRKLHPMNCVSYDEASTYCHAVGKRLPTEEEWEFAARGGAEERTYPWGNAEPSRQLCWSGLTKLEGTCPVRSFPPGAFGLFDMSGNVSEWTSSAFSPERKDARVCRGGGWSDARALDFRGAYRDSDLGFRCARGAAEATKYGF